MEARNLKTVKELYALRSNMPVIDVAGKKQLEEMLDGYLMPMKFDIMNIVIYKNFYNVYLNFEPHKDFNKTVAVPIIYYVDGNNKENWKSFLETNEYKEKNGIFAILFDMDEDIFLSDCFDFSSKSILNFFYK